MLTRACSIDRMKHGTAGQDAISEKQAGQHFEGPWHVSYRCAETDRWISLHLSDCNFLLVDAFAAYRHAWPLMDKAAMERVEHRSRELIENAWRGMDMALATGSGTNGWVMAWKHLEGAVECINRLALLLRDLYLSRNQPVERDRMELLLKRVNAIKTDMAHYGKQVKGADVIHVL